ncbi:Glucosylceramidase [Papilio xuthus]|uniref:Glucosylceramidase n=1 Tax=Papilio xuthus TaxID=66420 RepID=A0A194PPY1_PAPXU|nr:Glucosylceramidase [Papilio xuthus]
MYIKRIFPFPIQLYRQINFPFSTLIEYYQVKKTTNSSSGPQIRQTWDFFYFTPVLCARWSSSRQIKDRSIICVCNTTYCDEFTREKPVKGGYVTYTSSEAGSRFKKGSGVFHDSDWNPKCCSASLVVNPKAKYQMVEGFGGAVTDAASINWKSLPEEMQQSLIDSYYSSKGLEYNMIRVPIGGCDFSTHAYAYNEQPENDVDLLNFNLTSEDFDFKIPMIRAINRVATAPVHIVATTWSPPIWMKTNHNISGYGRLKKEYFQTYAWYHYKFIEQYAAQGISIWAITTTNEPIDGFFGLARFNTLGWSIDNMAEWIVKNLGPTIRNSKFKDVKILTCDDQRFTIPFWFNVMLRTNPKALEYIDGVGVHFYADKVVPASILNVVSNTHPDKFILATEACEGSFPWQTEKVDLGSWKRAVTYISDILEDLYHNVVGWIDWNLCLNTRGGPNWSENYVDSPIIVDAVKNEFYKQPMFYAMGHFSKFIKRGSRRIEVNEIKPLFSWSVKHVGFLTPDGTVVLVLFNE